MGDMTEDAQAHQEQESIRDLQEKLRAARAGATPEPEDAEVVDEPEQEADPLDVYRSFLLRKAISDRVAAQVKGERADIFQELRDLQKKLGVKQLQVNLPDGTPVATITVSQPSTKLQADPDQLLEYLDRTGREDLVDVEVIPAQAERTVRRIKPHALEALTTDVAWIDGHPVNAEGEMLEFITQETPAPSSFTVKYAAPKGQMKGDDRLIQSWLDGQLAQLDTGPDLPQLGQ